LNPRHFGCFAFILVLFGEPRLLSRAVQVTGAARWAATRIMVGVGDLVQRTGDGRTGWVLCGRMIGRSGDVVCDLHCARGDEEHEFLS
jgi:hypothetical protein